MGGGDFDLLILGLIGWRIEEGNGEMDGENLGMCILLSEFMGIRKSPLSSVCKVEARRHGGQIDVS